MAQPRGKDGRWIKSGGGLAAAVLVAVALGSGTGGAGAGVAGSGGGSGAARAGSGQVKARAGDTARTVLRLERIAERLDQVTSAADDDCAAHATGRVREFFRRHPCEALFRALFEVRDGRGAVVRVAVAWVDMPDAELARQYRALIDAEGTGTVRPLTRDGRRDDTGFDGVAYASVRQDATVVISQAEPVGRAAVAVELAEDAVDAATSG